MFGGKAAAERIRGYNRSMRLIVLLRDPLTRAYSAWNMYRRYCRENPDWFSRWMQRCDESVPADFFARRPSAFGSDFERDVLEEIAVTDRGRTMEMPILPLGEYFKLLKPYFDCFSREQILVFSSEQMQQDTEGHLRRFESFVGLAHHHWSQKQLAPRFVGGYAEPIPAKAAEAVKAFYQAQNRELFKLLGTEFPWAC